MHGCHWSRIDKKNNISKMNHKLNFKCTDCSILFYRGIIMENIPNKLFIHNHSMNLHLLNIKYTIFTTEQFSVEKCWLEKLNQRNMALLISRI